MQTLWVMQTNKQAFLDDCKKYQVYGIPKPTYKGVQQLREGDTVLLRLKLRQAQTEFGYLGPYQASLKKKSWVDAIEDTVGPWQKLKTRGESGPRWLSEFPWCIFLLPATGFIDDLRTLAASISVPACEPIRSPVGDKILRHLVQADFLPEKPENGYRTIRGVWVRSRAEYMIDNWFSEHQIVTYYEKAIYIDSVRIAPDWLIPSIGVYVEFLGLKGDPSYDRTWSQKERAYQEHGLNYITLEDADLTDLDRSLPKKLPQLFSKDMK
jgi:hypothetical protein